MSENQVAARGLQRGFLVLIDEASFDWEQRVIRHKMVCHLVL